MPRRGITAESLCFITTLGVCLAFGLVVKPRLDRGRGPLLLPKGPCRGETAGEGNKNAAPHRGAAEWEEAVASNTRAAADTFPKLLLRNANSFGQRPAMRHKDLGIWQTWTWAQVRDEVLALAAGLHRLGLKRGDTIAIVGSNRPRLYWSVAAAQALGAIPVPVYADAVADELAFVLAHAEVRFAAVEDQEQVDKILSVSDRLPKLEQMVYDEQRGLRDYDHAKLHAIDEVIAGGRKALTEDRGAGELARYRDRGGQGLRHLDHPLHLRHHRTVQGRGALGRALHRRGLRHRRLRQADREGRGAGLSAARLGRRPLSQLCAGHGRGLLHGLPGERRHRDGGPARDRSDVLLRAAAHLRADADAADDPHGGRELRQAQAVPLFHRRGQAIRRGDPQQAAGAAARPAALLARQCPGVCAAEERARAVQRAHRLHRGRSDRPRSRFPSIARSG